MPECQDLAVERVEAVERLLQPDLPLGPLRGLAGCGVPAQELGRQRRRGRLGHGAAVQRDLPPRVAALRTQVAAMLLQQPLAGDVPQPEEERHLRVLAIFGQAAAGFQHRVLDDVRGVDPPLEAAVEAHRDHAPQAVAMPGQQLAPRLLVAPDGAVDQAPCLDFAGFGRRFR